MTTAQTQAPPQNGVNIDFSYPNRSILMPGSGFMSEYHFTLNPYQGCAFGCQYCYAAAFIKNDKPPFGKADWGRWVRVKQNAVAMVRDAVAKGQLNGKSVYMSTATDPYQPTERRTGLTRQILQEMTQARGLKLLIQTRGTLADNDEDIDLCRRICANGGRVQMNMTITTNDEGVRRACEPTCPSYRRRLDTISAIAAKTKDDAGYTCCVTMSPLLPTEDPEGLADDLLASGVDRFIIQPTHTGQPSGGRYVKAVTRNEIVAALAAYWDCPEPAVRERYHHAYRNAVDTIVPRLEAAGAKVGFGKNGFAPPWDHRWHSNGPDRAKHGPRQ